MIENNEREYVMPYWDFVEFARETTVEWLDYDRAVNTKQRQPSYDDLLVHAIQMGSVIDEWLGRFAGSPGPDD